MVKRVALWGAALALEPELLVLDEPTAGLDPDLADNFVQLIGMLQKQLGFTVVMVTHDLDTLAGLATRVAVVGEQRIIAHGSPPTYLMLTIRSFEVFRFRTCADVHAQEVAVGVDGRG